MAQPLLSVATKGIITKLLSLATEEISLVWGFKPELERFRKKLEMIQEVITDAERRQGSDGSVQLWLKNLKGIAHEADDVLDDFSYEILRRNVEKSKVRDIFSSSNPISFRSKMAHKIKKINASLEEINSQASEYGLQRHAYTDNTPEITIDRETHSFLDDSENVGRDDEVSKIVDMLLLDSNNQEVLCVIPIVGMGGIGKTTFAKLIYNHEKLKQHFDVKMWVCVSDNFDVKMILRNILECLTENISALQSKHAILQSLQKQLEGKKYLLVLDDVWNENSAMSKELKSCLSAISRSTGNGVVVTTRSDQVASIMETLPRYHLAKLSNDDCWSIFKQTAFARGQPITPDLEAIGREIVQKSAGVPLAAKVLGGMMHSKKTIDEWHSVLNSDIWNLPEDDNGIFPVLKLSFNHLPFPTLKQCFAYCSIFPKDSLIGKDDLVQLWMAQGLLPVEGDQEMEDVGNFYFNILLSNSLFQDVEKDKYDNVQHCKMHDLVHDLTLSISRYDCIILKDGVSDTNDISEVQHLNMLSFDEDRIPQNLNVYKFRTLFSNGSFLIDISTKFKCLHVLNLRESGIKELPVSIGKMRHLRYLNVSWTKIKALPNTITKLYNLQTLSLLYYRSLEELPKEFQKLASLRHLNMDDDEDHRELMPSGIGKLTCLQTLPFFVVGQDQGHRIEELGCIGKLKGTLKIYGLEKVRNKEEAERADLFQKSNIQNLELNWKAGREEGIDNDENVLEGLKPHSRLKSLKITNFKGENFGSWMTSDGSFLQSLVEIVLIGCKRCQQIPTLGHLPFLKVVKVIGLHNVRRIGDEFYGVDGGGSSNSRPTKVFPALRVLTLVDMPNLEEWSEASSSLLDLFPCLEKLTIRSCPRLISVPGQFPFLKKLFIEEINSMVMEKMSSKLTCLTSLEMRNVSGPRVDVILEQLLENNTKSLNDLDINDCEELLYLPSNLPKLASLDRLTIWNCHNLTHIILAEEDVKEIEIKTSSSSSGLTRLSIKDCKNLRCLSKGLLRTLLVSLQTLEIRNCPNLMANPHDDDDVVVVAIRRLASLRSLDIRGCEGLRTAWEEGLFCHLTGLQNLTIGEFSLELEYFPWPSEVVNMEIQYPFVSLKKLALSGWPKLKSLPDQIKHLTALTDLIILSFHGLETLPDWLGNISSLQYLCLWRCTNLMNLPSVKAMQRLTNLRSLDIDDCPLLKERCSSHGKGSGPEWHKISHMPSIRIDWITIQDASTT